MIMSTFRAFAAGVFALGAAACTETSQRASVDPPGTAVQRTFDRAAGTNTSGAFPAQSDGTRNNPPGTAVERAFDRAAGTNTSGAYPLQSDGMPGNPPGTAIDRALGNRR
jgi:hypothetical protein